MRRSSSWTAVLAVVLCSGSLSAQDLPTTNDVGITITADDLTTAIQESTDFWGPVRKHLMGPDCVIGVTEHRHAATQYLKKIQDSLHQRLFEMTEVEALDLITYLGHRLRMFEVYRQLRVAINDDALLFKLVADWEEQLRAIHTHPAEARGPKIDELLARMTAAMKKASLDEAKIAAADKLWKLQSQVSELMAATGAGKMMIAFEIEADALPEETGDTLLAISQAADWVLIIREPKASVGRVEFLAAFTALDDFRGRDATASNGVLNR